MKKFFSSLSTITFAVLLSACGSQYTQIQVAKAPEIILPGVKTLRIERFKSSSGGNDYDLASLTEINRTNIATALSSTDIFNVVEYGDADAVLGGNVIFNSRVGVKKNESKDSEGKITYKYTADKVGELKVSLLVKDTKGKLIKNKNFVLTDGSSNTSASQWDAKQALKSDYDMLNTLMGKMESRVVKSLTPYTVTESRKFEAVKKNDAFKEANKQASSGDWQAALAGWKSAEATGYIEKAASLYNQSIYYEAIGDLNKAKASAAQAFQLNQTPDHSERIAHIDRMIKSQEVIAENF